MDHATAIKVYETIRLTGAREALRELVRLSVRYARIRADWATLTRAEMTGQDHSRTLAHNAVIDACDALCVEMAARGEAAEWREWMGQDRKDIGDFACWLHCFLGISAR